MKCEHCDSEWKITGTAQIMFCPFCHNPLIKVLETFHNLEEVLLYLTTEYGFETLRNKQNTLQFIEYFFPDGRREYNSINMIYASGLMETIYRVKASPEAIQNSAIRQVKAQISEKYGVSSEWADYVVGCICKSLGMANNVDRSIFKIKQLAEKGDCNYQFELAECYRTGKNTERDPQKYLTWLERSANNGNPIAMFQLGEELWHGSICEQNPDAAIRFLEESVRFGNRDAVCLIAGNKELYECCSVDVYAHIQKMLDTKNELSAKQLLGLSRYFLRGNNFEKSIDLARLAYEKDEKMSWADYVKVLQLGNSYESRVLALKVLREAATSGSVSACKILGDRYEYQAKTESDMMTALYWYRIAAEAGDVDAQLHIAQVYEHGAIVQKDIDKAIYWYRIAAYNGSQLARSKVSYKSRDCIINTLTLVFEDDSELVCRVGKAVTYHGNDYLIVSDSETREIMVIHYIENNTIEGFEIEGVDADTETAVLRIYGGEVK